MQMLTSLRPAATYAGYVALPAFSRQRGNNRAISPAGRTTAAKCGAAAHAGTDRRTDAGQMPA